MNDQRTPSIHERIAQWDSVQRALDTERIRKLRSATEAERMAERLLIFADVDPNAAWVSRRTRSGLVEQQVLLRRLKRQ
jgi:hypothetical protein